MVWRLTPAGPQAHQDVGILNFAKVPENFLIVAKELFYALLAGPIPAGETRPAVVSLRLYFKELVRFFTWLDQRPLQRCQRLESVTGDDLAAYQKYLLARLPAKHQTRVHGRSAVRLLYRWRSQLRADQLLFDPRHVEGWSESKRRGRENDTNRVPEEVMGPLYVWALRFIDVFAPDILTASAHWQRPVQRRPHSPGDRTVKTRLTRVLDTYLEQRKPLPATRFGALHLEALAAEANCATSSVEHRYWDLVEQAVSAVGLDEGTPVDVPVRGQLDGRPWAERIYVTKGLHTEVRHLLRMLQTACYIVIAYLSGMRDSEVKHLRRGCVRVELDEAGHPYRWKVNGLAFKGEDETHGVPATWHVGEPVTRAIAVLEAIHPPQVDLLFAPPHPGVRTTATQAAPSSVTNLRLRKFIKWVNEHCARYGHDDAIPDVDGRPWHLHTRQFRRTLAWYIARRPGGAIAGALQFRHHSIQMFEGYAGTSDSGFRAEVESEQALSRGEHYMAMIDAHEHEGLAGPAADEAERRLADFGHRARFQGQVVTDQRRLQRILKRHDPAVYPGEFVTCVHDHPKALCEKARRGRSEQLPDHGGCKPLACRNVTLTQDNIAAWLRVLERIDRRLAAQPALPPLRDRRMRARREEVIDFLVANTPEGTIP
ncbi:hypothetical protein ACFYN3_25260 [Streptomyces lavendulae]|uniref:hypothetical protein n=1 Tax=Streptomyces lavendulae TaxID=1914 RepID=UPI0033F2A198